MKEFGCHTDQGKNSQILSFFHLTYEVLIKNKNIQEKIFTVFC